MTLRNIKKGLILLTVIATMMACGQSQGSQSAPSKNEKQKIKNLLLSYGKALNAASVKDVVPLFAENGVFMPAASLTAIGHDQIKSAFDDEFKNIKLNIAVIFDEIVQQGDFAYVRTRSKGTITILSKNITMPTDKYRAFFVLEKVKGKWKIARFMFNFTSSL
ncbi:MAG TPA: SgcJ/EcaC family oxidoreductase [Spirochaetes bacterium]|nr:SgcJ/EcaC family oxidoreductase [Spirochaetota bacterium]